jgi:hypothetical protein
MPGERCEKFYVILKETFDSTRNCLVDCKATSSPSAVGVDTIENPAVDTSGLATAVDLNGDGYPDVVTDTEVFLNPGDGQFTSVKGMPWRTPSAAGAQDATSVVGVDVDGDGDNDLVVSQQPTSSTNGGIFVLYNPGSGLAADKTGMALNGWWGNPNSMQKLVSHTTAGGVAHAIKAPHIYVRLQCPECTQLQP